MIITANTAIIWHKDVGMNLTWGGVYSIRINMYAVDFLTQMVLNVECNRN
jgi:hypothetical protein